MLITGSGYGRVVALRLEAATETAIRAVLPFWWTPADGRPEQVWDVPDPAAAVATVRALELWVAEHSRDLIFVHAAALAVSGRALLLPGRSMAGKTTLTAALLAAGADYLSDEYAVLDAAGHVHPYPRPLSVRTPDGRRTAVPASELGARTAATSLPVAAVAALRYVPGAVMEFRPLSAADAVLRLLDNTVGARSAPEAALDAALGAVGGASMIEGTRGEAADIVPDLLGMLRTTG